MSDRVTGLDRAGECRRPETDQTLDPLTAILFLGALTAGIVFVAYSIYVDIDATGTKISSSCRSSCSSSH